MWHLPVPDTAWTVERSIHNEQIRQHQQHLNVQLSHTLSQGTLQSIKTLLQQGAKMDEHAMRAAIGGEDVEVLDLLVEYGWDIDSTAFSDCPIK